MLLPIYLDLLVESERALAYSFRTVAYGHSNDADVYYLAESFSTECDEQVERLLALASRFATPRDADPECLHATPMTQARTGPLGLLRDLQELHALVAFVGTTGSLVHQAGMGLDDSSIIEVASRCQERSDGQLAWLRTRLRQAAPQALIVG